MAEQVAYLLKLVGHINHFQDGDLDAREVIVDCLTDLMHFAKQEGVNFENASTSADHHFFCEDVVEGGPE